MRRKMVQFKDVLKFSMFEVVDNMNCLIRHSMSVFVKLENVIKLMQKLKV